MHSSPAYGLEDFNSCVAHGLAYDDILNPVQGNGAYAADFPLFGGMNIWKAAPRRHRGAEAAPAGCSPPRPLTHSYPHCWRHKSPVIYRAAAQWFIRMDEGDGRVHEGQGAAARCARRRWTRSTRRGFYPENGRARLRDMIANRPDWCISRQRSWGVPLPFFLHKDTGDLHPRTMEILDQAAAIVEAGGIEAWSRATAEADPRRRRRRALHEEQRHPRGLVRLGLDLLPRAARHAPRDAGAPRLPRQRPRGRPLPRRPRPAPRLVPLVAADRLRARRPRALPRPADARLHGRQPGPQDEQVARQRHRAAGGEPEARRRDHPPVGRGERLLGRHRRRRQDPRPRRRRLPAHPQHAALPARQHERLRRRRRMPCRSPRCSRSTAGRWRARRSSRPRCSRTTRSTSSTRSSPSCRSSAARTSARSTSTS